MADAAADCGGVYGCQRLLPVHATAACAAAAAAAAALWLLRVPCPTSNESCQAAAPCLRRSARKYMIVFFLVASLALLFLDWCNS